MTFFDEAAKTYDDWYETPLGQHVYQVETECAFNLFDLPKGTKILDVGCGSGIYSMQLAEMGYKVTGIDISVEMLKKAQDKALEKGLDIDFIEMDVYNLTFEEDSFDGVFSMAAFEFIHDDLKAIDEMFRVLKVGGQMMIGTIHLDSEWGKLYTSPEMMENTVFKHSNLKTMDQMKVLHSEQLIDYKECLFIPPYSKNSEITIDNEKSMKEKGSRGGFICLKWIK